MLITCLSSGGEHDLGYINTLTGVGFLRRCDPAVVFTLQTESHASPPTLWNVCNCNTFLLRLRYVHKYRCLICAGLCAGLSPAGKKWNSVVPVKASQKDRIDFFERGSYATARAFPGDLV